MRSPSSLSIVRLYGGSIVIDYTILEESFEPEKPPLVATASSSPPRPRRHRRRSPPPAPPRGSEHVHDLPRSEPRPSPFIAPSICGRSHHPRACPGSRVRVRACLVPLLSVSVASCCYCSCVGPCVAAAPLATTCRPYPRPALRTSPPATLAVAPRPSTRGCPLRLALAAVRPGRVQGVPPQPLAALPTAYSAAAAVAYCFLLLPGHGRCGHVLCMCAHKP